MTRYVVTGGAGFVGSHLVRHLLVNTDAHLVLPVTFRNRGNADRLKIATDDHPEWRNRMTVMHHDLRGPFSVTQLHTMGQVDAVFNLAANSHVDRSIVDPVPFFSDNVASILNMLELARQLRPSKFIQISTDEVYGPAPEHVAHAEWSPIIPSNPYSASKAAQEAAAVSYWRTYGVPVILTNTMNIIGETQDREKFVPLVMHKVTSGGVIQVHADTDGRPGSRFYLHARNQADALLFIAENVAPELYPDTDRPQRLHIVGEREVDNMTMAHLIADAIVTHGGQMRDYHIEPVSFHASRPGHDLRYALDGSKIARLGWKAPISFEESLERTVRWTLKHPEWLL